MRRTAMVLALALAVIVTPVLTAPPARAAPRTIYFPEGTTRSGFDEVLYLANSGPDPVRVQLEFVFADGSPAKPLQSDVPPFDVAPINVRAVVGADKDVSIVMQSPSSAITAARRIQVKNKFFPNTGLLRAATTSAGIEAPDTQWNLAEGTTLPGFQEYITIQNPSNQAAQISISYGLEGQPGPTTNLIVAARSRATVDVNSPAEVGNGSTGVSARVVSTNDVPVLVERPIYFTAPIAGSADVYQGGTVAPGARPQPSWFFAEGNVLAGWYEFLTLFNPGPTAQDAALTYFIEGAGEQGRTVAIPPGSRRTVQVFSGGDGVGRNATPAPSKGVSVRVDAQGIIAERPVYGRSAVGIGFVDDAHAALGATTTLRCAQFAYVDTIGPSQSFLTLANTGADPVGVRVLPLIGSAPVPVNRTIPGRGRLTVDMSDVLDDKVYGLRVEATTPGAFVAELPVYPALFVDSIGFGENGAGVLASTPC